MKKRKQTVEYKNGYDNGHQQAIRDIVDLGMIDNNEIVYLISQEIREIKQESKKLEEQYPKK